MSSELVVTDVVYPNQGIWHMVVATESIKPTHLPPWDRHIENRLSLVPISKIHYICMVAVNNVVTKAFIDSGRARSLIDLRIDRKLNLPAKLATKHHNSGCFLRSNAKLVWYMDKVKGPISL